MKPSFWLLVLCLTGCAPALPAPDTALPVTAYLPGPASGVVPGPVAAQWWQDFSSPALDALVVTGLQANPTIGEAEQNLAAAEQNAAAANGAYLPQVGVNPNASRQSYPSGPNGYPPYTIFSITGTISYDPGLFGARRYTFENGAALADYQQAELDAAKQSLVGNIVAAAITEAGAEAQIAVEEQIIAAEQRLLTLLNGEYADGAIPQLSVLQQQSQILAAQAALPPLQSQADEARDRLAILTGRLPADAFSRVSLDELTIPAEVPIAFPSAYLANRPDIRAARAGVAAQNAALGIAVAHLYPDLTLSANGGYASETLNALFEPGAAFWTLAANLLQPLYDGGVLHAQKRQAQAELAAALFAYRAAVLNAFGEAADALQAVQNDRTALQSAVAAAQTAEAAFKLGSQQFSLGAVDYTTVLNAQEVAAQQALNIVQARTTLLLDIARLQSAMAR